MLVAVVRVARGVAAVTEVRAEVEVAGAVPSNGVEAGARDGVVVVAAVMLLNKLSPDDIEGKQVDGVGALATGCSNKLG